MPVYGFQLMSVRGLVKGKNTELKRRDGISDKPEIFKPHASDTGSLGKTRFKLH